MPPPWLPRITSFPTGLVVLRPSVPFPRAASPVLLAAAPWQAGQAFAAGAAAPVHWHSLVRTLARAFRWRRMLETGTVATVTEIAAKERINASYVSRILRLTLLAPDIVEAILDGRQAPEMTLPMLMGAFPVAWDGQRKPPSSDKRQL